MILRLDALFVRLGFGSSIGLCGFVILIARKRYRTQCSRGQTSVLAKINVCLSMEY